ncbi:MAG: twin-arginine translocase TatA/TatE family subunit [Alphaproteobacteria bacterium]|nr:twin-arginine translocase TatA/TatE family subunit [Alphaproteobacteria bacterium]
MQFGFWQILLIVVLIFILFGSQKFPSVMKNLAEGINIFKKEMGGKPKDKDGKTVSASAKTVSGKSVNKKPAKKVSKKK